MIIDEEKFKRDIEARTIAIYDYYKNYSKSLGLNKNIDRFDFRFELNEIDDEINGKAWSGDNIFNISINIGLIIALIRYYNKFFEPIEVKLKESELISLDSSILELKLNDNLFLPKYINTNIIELMVVLSYRFIILHELGHLFNGHCDYLKSLKNDENFKLKMVDKEKKYECSALIERTLEFDADSFAASQSILYINEVILNPKLLKYDLRNDEDKYDIAFWFGFSLETLFLMLIDEKLCLDLNKQMGHLPGDVRLSLIFGSICKASSEYSIPDVVIDIVALGMKFAESWFNEIKCTNYNFVESVRNKNEVNEYFEEIKKCWDNKLCNELQKYSSLNLYTDN